MTPTDDRALVERARAEMAERARLPWWYVCAQGLAMLAVLLQAPLTRLHPHVGLYAALGWPIVIVLLVVRPMLHRSQGAQFGRAPLSRYPSTRRPGIAFLAFAVAGILMIHLLLRAHMIRVAIVAAVVVAAASAVYQVRENAAVRRDIREGRVNPS